MHAMSTRAHSCLRYMYRVKFKFVIHLLQRPTPVYTVVAECMAAALSVLHDSAFILMEVCVGYYCKLIQDTILCCLVVKDL